MTILILPPAVMGQSPDFVRIGFSSSIFGDVNRNDAIAAVRAWSRVFADEMEIASVPQPLVLEGPAEIRAALRSGTLDYVNLAMDEYADVRELLPADKVSLGKVSGRISNEYVLLVTRDSGIDSLDDLKGRKLRLLVKARSALARTWLDVILMREGLAPAAGFLGAIDKGVTVGKVLLPVFFGQADACVVTRSGFETMAELNPQIGRKLRTIAVSIPLVPSVFCPTPHVDEALREKVSREIISWHHTAAGKQCLTIFQTDSIGEHPVSDLLPTLELLAERERLMAENVDASGDN